MPEGKRGVNKNVLIASIIGIVAVIAIMAYILPAITAGIVMPLKGDDFDDDEIANIEPSTISTFQFNANTVCTENGKPVIRLFSTTVCPHCSWSSNTFDKVAKYYVDRGKIVAYHWELDTTDNTLTLQTETSVPASEQAIFSQFNPQNSIPTFVFGCKYYRVGNGYERQNDLTAEIAEFKAVIEALIKEAKQNQ